VLFLLGGWEKFGQGVLYPDVFPPAEGWEGLRRLVKGLHSLGFRVGFFILAPLLRLTNYSQGRDIILDVYGEPYSLNSRYVFMNPSSEYWASQLVNISVTLVKETGVDLLYYDTAFHTPINYGGSIKCPKGGGNYSVKAWATIFEKIREQTRDIKPDLAIVVEQVSEPLIPYVDGSFSASTILKDILLPPLPPDAKPIDLFSELYGRRLVLMGWCVLIREQISHTIYEGSEYWRRLPIDDTLTYLLVARLFLYGYPVSLGGFHEGALTGETTNLLIQEEKLRFYEKLAYARLTYLYQFLVKGKMVRSIDLGSTFTMHCPRGEIRIENCSRRIVVNALQGAEWVSPGGDKALILVNIWNRPVRIILNESYDLIIIDGLPINLTDNQLIIEPHGLVALISSNKTLSKYLTHLHSTLMGYIQYSIEDLKSRHLNTSKLEKLAEEIRGIKSMSLSQIIQASNMLKELITTASKEGYLMSAPLEITINYWSFLDSFAAVHFENAQIVSVVRAPIFLEGNGVLYVSKLPLGLGYPHWDRWDEKTGYHVVLFPSYTWDANYIEHDEAKVVIRLAIEPEVKDVKVLISAGESWHREPRIRVTVRNLATGRNVLEVDHWGGGWKEYSIPVKNLLPSTLNKSLERPHGSWIFASPSKVVAKVKISVKNREVELNVTLTYPHKGFKEEWNAPSISQNNIYIDVEVYEWTGATVQVTTVKKKTFMLRLNPGNYSVIIRVNGVEIARSAITINETTKEVTPSTGTSIPWPLILGGALILIIVLLLYVLSVRRRLHSQKHQRTAYCQLKLTLFVIQTA